MTPIFFTLAFVAAVWAILNFAAAAMHPAPSQTNLGGQVVLYAAVAVVAFGLGIVSIFAGG